MSLEASAIALTTAVVKAAAKIWLGDRPIAADATAKVFDLLEKQVTGLNDRRKLRLLFTNLESRVADRLLPFLDVEFRALPEHERAAAVDAARETFDRAALTDDDLFATDLDAAFLYRSLLRTVPGVPREFLLSADAVELYQRVLRECCAYLVQVTSTLPRFQPGALVEILQRETEILETVRNVLAALPEQPAPGRLRRGLPPSGRDGARPDGAVRRGPGRRDAPVPAVGRLPEPECQRRPGRRVRRPDRARPAAHVADLAAR